MYKSLQLNISRIVLIYIYCYTYIIIENNVNKLVYGNTNVYK